MTTGRDTFALTTGDWGVKTTDPLARAIKISSISATYVNGELVWIVGGFRTDGKFRSWYGLDGWLQIPEPAARRFTRTEVADVLAEALNEQLSWYDIAGPRERALVESALKGLCARMNRGLDKIEGDYL